MIKYIPVRRTPSASAMDEQIFETIEDMKQYILGRWSRFVSFVGSETRCHPDSIVISGPLHDIWTGYRNLRTVSIGETVIGFCGE